MKKTISRIFFVLVLYGSIESLAYLGLIGFSMNRSMNYNPVTFRLSDLQKEQLKRLLSKGPVYENYDPLLGWSIIPNGSKHKYRSNSQGLRASQEYSSIPDPGITRIMAFGDSFTHGNEVSNSNTWEEILQHLDPELEVLNFGVSNYGLDQAFLRYQRDGSKFQSHIVLIGFMSDDIYRNVSVFHVLKDSKTFPFAKPRYQIRDKKLILLENPIKKITDYKLLLEDRSSLFYSMGKNDLYFNSIYHESVFDFLPSVKFFKIGRSVIGKHSVWEKVLVNGIYATDSEAFQITSRILSAFYEEVLNRGAIPIILLFPGKADIISYKRYGISGYKPLADYCSNHGYRFIDLKEAFDEETTLDNLDRYFVTYHFSPGGNRIVAKSILKYLHENGIKRPN